MKILVTGACGFIGYHLCTRLLELGHQIIGVDSMNNYYDIQIKYDRYEKLKNYMKTYFFHIEDPSIYTQYIPKVDLIIHLAAQAGVRYSLVDPDSYVNTNILGFFELMKYAKNTNCEKVIYASSASVYGNNKLPWNEEMCLKPISLYGATKVSTEVIADSYNAMFGIQTIGLRFFSVYGPWGRPDLSLWKWTEGILKREPIKIFNYGKSERSWTYIDDLIDGVISSLSIQSQTEKFNLGNDKMLNINYSVDCIANYLEIFPKKEFEPMQDGDIPEANPDLEKSRRVLNFNPKIEFEEGIKKFIDWFRSYKKI
jgi:UDP-glucuronate 4-epimerase